jgi:hypothetical protein
MNPRERMLAICVIGTVILAAAAFFGYQLFWVPFSERRANLTRLRDEGEAKQQRIIKILEDRGRLQRARQLSLPLDVNLARVEYQRFLDELLRKNKFGGISVAERGKADSRNVPTTTNKVPVYTRVTFSAQGRANLSSIVAMLQGFYRTPLMHQVKRLSIHRPATAAADRRPDELELELIVEAIIVNGADKRPQLLPFIDRRLVALDAFSSLRGAPVAFGLASWGAGPSGPVGPRVLADPHRDYSAIAAKNIFFGNTPVVVDTRAPEPEAEVLKYVRLTTITTDWNRYDKRREAELYDVWLGPAAGKMRLRSTAGFNTFNILRSTDNTLVVGEVVRIDERDVIFRVALNAKDPEEGEVHYKDREAIYHLYKETVADLIDADELRKGDAQRVYWVDRGRWQALLRDKVVTVTNRQFAFRWGLVRGKVIRDDEKGVILCTDEKYCAYDYGQGERGPRPNEGYCKLHIGYSVAEALIQPLEASEVKKIKESLAAKP